MGPLWQLKGGIEEEDVLAGRGGGRMHGVHLFTCVVAFMQMLISTPRMFVPDAWV